MLLPVSQSPSSPACPAEVLHAFGPVTRSNMVALAGEIGFWLLVLEAGLELDANMLLEIGLRAFMVALTGFVTSSECGAAPARPKPALGNSIVASAANAPSNHFT